MSGLFCRHLGLTSSCSARSGMSMLKGSRMKRFENEMEEVLQLSLIAPNDSELYLGLETEWTRAATQRAELRSLDILVSA